MVPETLAIPVTLHEVDGQHVLQACAVHPCGLFLVTDRPMLHHQVVRVAVRTHDVEALTLLGVVEDMISPRSARAHDRLPGVTLRWHSLGPFVRTLWMRWLTWLHDHVAPSVGDVEALDALRKEEPLLRVPVAAVRRRYPRFQMSWQLRLLRGSETEECDTHNISRGGVCVRSRMRLAIDDEVGVVLFHPQDGAQFKVAARVRWLDYHRHTEARFGLVFQAQASVRSALEEFVQSGIPAEERSSGLLLMPDALLDQ